MITWHLVDLLHFRSIVRWGANETRGQQYGYIGSRTVNNAYSFDLVVEALGWLLVTWLWPYISVLIILTRLVTRARHTRARHARTVYYQLRCYFMFCEISTVQLRAVYDLLFVYSSAVVDTGWGQSWLVERGVTETWVKRPLSERPLNLFAQH